MEAIQDFFNNLTTVIKTNENERINLESWKNTEKGSFAYLHQEVKENAKDVLMIHITRTEYLKSVLIPLFDF